MLHSCSSELHVQALSHHGARRQALAMTSHRNLAAVAALTVFTALAGAAAVGAGPAAPVTLRSMYGLQAPDRLSRAHTALLLVDYQEEFVHGKLRLPDAPSAIARAGELLAWA